MHSAATTTLSAALRSCRLGFAGVALFSAVVNVLALTGSLYMLQVYDRVIPSHSVPTLVGLSILMVGMYVANGGFEWLRTRVLSRIGLRFDRALRRQVFSAMLMQPIRSGGTSDGQQPARDLDQIRSFLSSAGPTALFDLPWMPMYMLLITLLHPWLGILATSGAVTLVAMTLLTEALGRRPTLAANKSAAALNVFGEASRRNSEVVQAMGLGPQLGEAWWRLSAQLHHDQLAASDLVTSIGTVSRVLRVILQSGVLGLGAYLTVKGEATGGVMIAASILTARALAPIEIAIANWRGFLTARQSYARLGRLLNTPSADIESMPLPAPHKSLLVRGLTVAAPGQSRPIIRNLSFRLEAGQGLGVIGPSASGKSTLARALVGVWLPPPLNGGAIRIDGAALDQWPSAALGRHIGYLPQDIELFGGSIAQNISRFRPDASSRETIAAATAAGVHDLVLNLEHGYDTRIGDGGVALSAGQRQRIALARALYGNPFLVVLDEPNSNLDAAGDAALTGAIKSVRSRGGIVIVIAHRPAALASLDLVLVLADGQQQAFGPKDEMLKAAVLAPPVSNGAIRPPTPDLVHGPAAVPLRVANGIAMGPET